VVLKKIWKPFYKLLDNLKNFKLGSRETVESIQTNVDEFISLNETIESLLQRTITTFNHQKQFIENAAHELQTPLAISINKLELLNEKENMSESQMREVGSIIQSLERLTRLNKTLLLVSKIENRQFPEEVQVDFNALADRVTTAFSDVAEYKEIKLTTIHEGELSKKMNPDLAEILLSNLVKNSILHNHPSGFVTVKISTSAISIENSSNTSALDETQIFQRFYKKSDANTSTGLGLAIVKSIADYYGFKVKYSFAGSHLFTITFQ
jgi:signal transduction histidine kinase